MLWVVPNLLVLVNLPPVLGFGNVFGDLVGICGFWFWLLWNLGFCSLALGECLDLWFWSLGLSFGLCV